MTQPLVPNKYLRQVRQALRARPLRPADVCVLDCGSDMLHALDEVAGNNGTENIYKDFFPGCTVPDSFRFHEFVQDYLLRRARPGEARLADADAVAARAAHVEAFAKLNDVLSDVGRSIEEVENFKQRVAAARRQWEQQADPRQKRRETL